MLNSNRRASHGCGHVVAARTQEFFAHRHGSSMMSLAFRLKLYMGLDILMSDSLSSRCHSMAMFLCVCPVVVALGEKLAHFFGPLYNDK